MRHYSAFRLIILPCSAQKIFFFVRSYSAVPEYFSCALPAVRKFFFRAHLVYPALPQSFFVRTYPAVP